MQGPHPLRPRRPGHPRLLRDFPLILPRDWYPNDRNQYAIRGHRHDPKLPYPKSPKKATFFTLGTSSSDFDNWKVHKYTGQIGELEINGEKGVRTALLTIWDSDTTLTTISLTTDCATDLLDPLDKFANKRIATRPANDSSAQESEQGETSDEEDAEGTRLSLKSPPAAKQATAPDPGVTRPVPVRRAAQNSADNLVPVRPRRTTPSVTGRGEDVHLWSGGVGVPARAEPSLPLFWFTLVVVFQAVLEHGARSWRRWAGVRGRLCRS